MRAAIYARRSTEEHQQDSLDVQLGEAKRFIASRGWTLDPAHIFVDNAISRSEFKKRPALMALANGADARHFDVIITRDGDRLGAGPRATILIQDMLDAGVRLFYYLSGQEVRLDDAASRFLNEARNFAAELEREKTSARTHENLLTKAREGYCVGGRTYGYDNVESTVDGKRRVRYQVNVTEAEVVREIFRRYAAGEGLRSIAKLLNARGVPRPRVGKRGTGSWAPSSLSSMLRNERYRGVLVWNRKEKTYRKGTKVRVAREHDEWVVAELPELAIITEDLWKAAHSKFGRVDEPKKNKRGPGRPFAHLLSGIARCSCCGGPMTVVNHKVGPNVVRCYTCAYHRERGPEVCVETRRVRTEVLNATVVEWVTENALSEKVALQVIDVVRQRLRERGRMQTTDVGPMEDELVRLRGEVDNLVKALAASSDKPDVVIQAISERRSRMTELEARIKVTKLAPDVIDMQLKQLETEVRQHLASLRELMDGDVPRGRAVIQALFDGPIKVSFEDGVGAVVEGTASLGKLLTSTAPSPNVASPTGFEPVLTA